PDRTKKPADTGYGPYADSFPLEQHRFGPLFSATAAPIRAFSAFSSTLSPSRKSIYSRGEQPMTRLKAV
ncbi:MAG TPA: hypothetical protein VLM42_06420, partial [Bryobacteraceae bacterium]|nr:hypothetical protein [Bryobacteraceae bacterium]